jgi:hypothetical protein
VSEKSSTDPAGKATMGRHTATMEFNGHVQDERLFPQMTDDKSLPHGDAVLSTLAVIFGCEDHSCKEQKADSAQGGQ